MGMCAERLIKSRFEAAFLFSRHESGEADFSICFAEYFS